MVGAVVDTATVVDDRYRVVRGIGAGTMGMVYEVEHIGFGRRLAMKVLHQQANRVESLRRRFEQEAYSAGRLDDPRIVDVTDVGQLPDGRPYIIMALIDGVPLSAEMSKGPMGVGRAVMIVRGILEALAHAHARGVVHRDLKPDNVMLVPGEPAIKLLDFGLARLMDPHPRKPITKAGAVFGTPRYMAPEQARGEGGEPRSDLYSVGVLLYEMVRGQPLFPASTAMEAMQRQTSDIPEPLIVPSDGTFDSEMLTQVVDQSLQKHPADRFRDAGSFIAALDAVMMPPDPPARTPPGWVFVAAGAVAAVLLVSGLTLSGKLSPDGAADGVRPADLAAVHASLKAGETGEATAAAEALVDKDPDRGANWLAMALARQADGDQQGTARALAQALRLEPDLASEPLLRSSIRDLVGSRSRELFYMLNELSESPEGPWAPLLTELAQTARRPHERRRAWEILERIDDFGTLDPFTYLSEQLRRNHTSRCQIRAWYVRRLIALEDPRVVPVLREEAARKRKQRACMMRDIEAALGESESETVE